MFDLEQYLEKAWDDLVITRQRPGDQTVFIA